MGMLNKMLEGTEHVYRAERSHHRDGSQAATRQEIGGADNLQ